MEGLSYESFFKRVLTFLKSFEYFSESFWFPISMKILNFETSSFKMSWYWKLSNQFHQGRTFWYKNEFILVGLASQLPPPPHHSLARLKVNTLLNTILTQKEEKLWEIELDVLILFPHNSLNELLKSTSAKTLEKNGLDFAHYCLCNLFFVSVTVDKPTST